MSSWRRHEKKLLVGRVQPGVSKLHNFEPRKTGKHTQCFFVQFLWCFFLKGCFGLHFLRAVEAGRGRHWRVQSSQSLFRAFCGECRRTESFCTCCANACTKKRWFTIWKHEKSWLQNMTSEIMVNGLLFGNQQVLTKQRGGFMAVPGFLLCVPFAGYIFPFPTFILMVPGPSPVGLDGMSWCWGVWKLVFFLSMLGTSLTFIG